MKRLSIKTAGIVSTAGLAVLELIAHLRQIKVPLLDQAFIASVGVLFAPKGEDKPKEDDHEKA